MKVDIIERKSGDIVETLEFDDFATFRFYWMRQGNNKDYRWSLQKQKRLRLGCNQKNMLMAIADRHGGVWFAGCGWVWRNHASTERLLRSLQKHNLIEYCADGVPGSPCYRVTDYGYTVAGILPDIPLAVMPEFF